MPTIITGPETEGIEGRKDLNGADAEVRLNDNSGHAIFVDRNTGRFIVRYKRDTNWDDAPGEDDPDVLERRYDNMTDVQAFIDRRYETQQRVKKTPLNLRVLTERGPVTVKAIHGGDNKPIFDVPAGQKKMWDDYRKGYRGEFNLYPEHEKVVTELEDLKVLLGRKEEIERQIGQARDRLHVWRIVFDSRSTDESFRQACFDALTKVNDPTLS